MKTAIREDMHPASNRRVGKLHPDADPTMTRAAREERAAWRLDHLDAWLRGLEALDHQDPEYEYDVAHEYEYDWTTDPATALPVLTSASTTRTA